MKNLIMIIGEDKYQFDTKEELLQNLLGENDVNYFSMSEEEQKEQRYLKAFINLMGQDNIILNLKESIDNNQFVNQVNEKFLIDNDDVYLMSLLRMNKIILLEEKNANIFTKSIDKTEISDNYIILNSYAEEIINNYIQSIT